MSKKPPTRLLALKEGFLEKGQGSKTAKRGKLKKASSKVSGNIKKLGQALLRAGAHVAARLLAAATAAACCAAVAPRLLAAASLVLALSPVCPPLPS